MQRNLQDLRAYFHFGYVLCFAPDVFIQKFIHRLKFPLRQCVCVCGGVRERKRGRESARERKIPRMQCQQQSFYSKSSLSCVKAFDSLLFITYNAVDQQHIYVRVRMYVPVYKHMYVYICTYMYIGIFCLLV